MTGGLIYLVTGANRGIGLGLVQSLIQRPNTTVIACARSSHSRIAEVMKSSSHPNNTLLTFHLDSQSDTDADDIMETLRTKHGIHRIDVVIANAGSSAGYTSVLDTPLEAIRSDYETNTLGLLKLFRACHGLLVKSSSPKFVLISSILGSIEAMGTEAGLVTSYGSSKAAANFMIKKIHCEHNDIVAFSIHPGWVRTSMGQSFADAVGVKEPPMTLETSVEALLEQIDKAVRDVTSGKFISYDGKILPW